MRDLNHFLGPSPADHALFGPRARLYCLARLANAALFALAFALVVVSHTVPPVSASPAFGHWRAGERALTVVDRTGDPAWHKATRWAVERWNAGSTGFRLRWARQTGPCEPDGTRVSVCLATDRELGALGALQFQGQAEQERGKDNHVKGAVVRVCSNCDLQPSRRRVVVTHELGHVFGLEHNGRPQSVMYHAGGPESPSADDYADLRRLGDHSDRGDGGCKLWRRLKLGPICL